MGLFFCLEFLFQSVTTIFLVMLFKLREKMAYINQFDQWFASYLSRCEGVSGRGGDGGADGMSGQDPQQGMESLEKHIQYYNLIIYLNIYIWTI